MTAYLLTRSTHSGKTGDPASALRRGAQRTLAVRSFTLEQSFSLQAGGNPSQQGSIHATVDLGSGKVQQRQTVSSGSSNASTMLTSDGSDVWLSSTASTFSSQMPTGKIWLKTSASELRQLGIWHPLPDALAALYLTRGAGTVTDQGPDIVAAGLSTRRYTFPVDLHQAYCATEPKHRPAVQRAPHAQGPSTVHGNAWIDSADRIVRLDFDLSVGDPSAGPEVKISETLQLTRLDQPVQVTAPTLGWS